MQKIGWILKAHSIKSTPMLWTMVWTPWYLHTWHSREANSNAAMVQIIVHILSTLVNAPKRLVGTLLMRSTMNGFGKGVKQNMTNRGEQPTPVSYRIQDASIERWEKSCATKSAGQCAKTERIIYFNNCKLRRVCSTIPEQSKQQWVMALERVWYCTGNDRGRQWP